LKEIKLIKNINFIENNLIQMDTALKYKIITEIIKSNDEMVLHAIKSLLKIEDERDFWEELSNENQAAIDEGLEQLDKGQYVSHSSIREEIKNRFNF
jgi:predicted transcriptional regulator